MSPIVGTYTNASLGAKLVITDADDSTGKITGTFSLNSQTVPVQGNWNTSTISPNAVFFFSGSVVNPTVLVAGAGASTNFQTFANTTISISLAQTGGVVGNVHGVFVRS